MKRLCLIVAAWLFPAALLFAQDWGVVNFSVCNMRRTADFDAEMVSQALLGTPVRILQWSGGVRRWPEIQTPDEYTGWVHYAVVVPMTHEELHAWNAAPKAVVTALSGLVYEAPSARSATISDVVGGDRLKLLGKKGCWLQVEFPDGRQGYLNRSVAQPEDEWRNKLEQHNPEAILSTARSMLGFPYLWAGMSPKGMDCSGFVRTVLFMHDIIIPRDAHQQVEVGARIMDKDALAPGDLVFFGRWDGETPRVSHVGFYLGDGRFIHSLGLVQIGSFLPEDPLYDAFNAGRYLFGTILLPYIDVHDGVNTTLTNPYYAE